jgi:hypothetical protein
MFTSSRISRCLIRAVRGWRLSSVDAPNRPDDVSEKRFAGLSKCPNGSEEMAEKSDAENPSVSRSGGGTGFRGRRSA